MAVPARFNKPLMYEVGCKKARLLRSKYQPYVIQCNKRFNNMETSNQYGLETENAFIHIDAFSNYGDFNVYGRYRPHYSNPLLRLHRCLIQAGVPVTDLIPAGQGMHEFQIQFPDRYEWKQERIIKQVVQIVEAIL